MILPLAVSESELQLKALLSKFTDRRMQLLQLPLSLLQLPLSDRVPVQLHVP